LLGFSSSCVPFVASFSRLSNIHKDFAISPITSVVCGVRVAQSLVLCLVSYRALLVFSVLLHLFIILPFNLRLLITSFVFCFLLMQTFLYRECYPLLLHFQT
jgi:hypothetical protein